MDEHQSIPTYQLLWAKTSKDKTQTHPLICHMIDVAQVTLALWETVLTAGLRRQFADTLGLDSDDAGRVLAFWAGLHDLGKATPTFQRQHSPAIAPLHDSGLDFPRLYVEEQCYHGTASARLMPGLLTSETGLAPRWAKNVARAVGGHHGAWPIPLEVQSLKSFHLGGGAWETVRRDLIQALRAEHRPPTLIREPTPGESCNALYALLSGLTSVADWIGSMETHFVFAERPVNLKGYSERAASQAVRTLARLHWTGWQPPGKPSTFSSLFGLGSPRPMQVQVIELATRLDHPALVIIEAPTGVGKTEAALFLADHWARTLQQRGLYVAMPTMATSNQMYGRVRDVLAKRYPRQPIRPLLVHGQAQWVRDDPPPQVNMACEEPQPNVDEADAMAWFLPRKRSLLAPFGVGTVDQTFLSVLQTRHFFVRLFGLSHKTIIFDEVHAYDTYMSTLFQRLLGWLRALGASVVVLSATLPAKTRSELLAAYAGEDTAGALEATYPAITWAMAGEAGFVPVEAPDSRTVALEWIDRTPENISAALRTALHEGGCAAVICNTVRRAQEVYSALSGARIVPDADLTLFHARFPFGWRLQIEADVLARFAKDRPRPTRAIVVATQVIEQSLDIDFDLMVSDLAPVDLLIQRIGRLHRHSHHTRPLPLTSPHLLIGRPDLDDGAPHFGADAYVYEPYVLLRSYLALQDRTGVTLPQDTTALIEAVYGDAGMGTGALAPALTEAYEKMRMRQDRDEDTARSKLIGTPQTDNLLTQSSAGLVEDALGVHQAFQAFTRLGPPSVAVSCLHQIGTRLNTEPNGSGRWVDLGQKPDIGLTQALMESMVDVSHRGVFGALLAHQVPPGWRDHPLLRNCRSLVFDNGACRLAGSAYSFRLTRPLGLEIVRI